MNCNLINWAWTLVFWALLVGCEQPKKTAPQKNVTKKELIKNNRQSVRMEADQINQFVKRRNWPTTITETGLHYWIYQKGKAHANQNKAKKGDIAVVAYEISLIDGSVIYTSKKEKPAEFRVGEDDVESGLQEGILFLAPGDKAKLVIPSHLAHGYTGDYNKIPQNATLIFDIELLELK